MSGRGVSAQVAFVLFAVGIAARDVITERLHLADSVCLTFVICAVIACISGLMLMFHPDRGDLLRKLARPRVAVGVTLLSCAAVAVYAVTIFMLTVNTAGVFDLLDYGLAPLLTVVIAWRILHEGPTWNVAVAFAIFVVGIFLVATGHTRSIVTGRWLMIGVISPIATAASDGLTKWLLTAGQLRRDELLFCRFAPASLILFAYAFKHDGGPHLEQGIPFILIAIFLGFAPLYLLCTGLGLAALTKYAAFEALIPALVFFGSLAWHPENMTQRCIAGAIVVLISVIIGEGSAVKYVARLFGGGAEEQVIPDT